MKRPHSGRNCEPTSEFSPVNNHSDLSAQDQGSHGRHTHFSRINPHECLCGKSDENICVLRIAELSMG